MNQAHASQSGQQQQQQQQRISPVLLHKHQSSQLSAESQSSVAAAASLRQLLDDRELNEQLLAADGPITAEQVAAACGVSCEQEPGIAGLQQHQGLGFSLVLRDVSQRIRAAARLVDSIEQQLGLPAGANLYYTPPGEDWDNTTPVGDLHCMYGTYFCCSAPDCTDVRG